MLSARNQFRGTVKSVKLGNVMAEVVVTVGALEVVSAITRTSAEQMGLKAGDQVTAIIKSTEVLIGKDYPGPGPPVFVMVSLGCRAGGGLKHGPTVNPYRTRCRAGDRRPRRLWPGRERKRRPGALPGGGEHRGRGPGGGRRLF